MWKIRMEKVHYELNELACIVNLDEWMSKIVEPTHADLYNEQSWRVIRR